MALKGGQQAIFAAQKTIASILADWQEEFDAYKERKSRRRYNRFKDSQQTVFEWPSISKVEKQEELNSSNPFAALDDLEETSVMEVIPIVKPKKATLTGWSKVVASSTYSETGSWADMSDDEE